jgi:hypothetical protein
METEVLNVTLPEAKSLGVQNLLCSLGVWVCCVDIYILYLEIGV